MFDEWIKEIEELGWKTNVVENKYSIKLQVVRNQTAIFTIEYIKKTKALELYAAIHAIVQNCYDPAKVRIKLKQLIAEYEEWENEKTINKRSV